MIKLTLKEKTILDLIAQDKTYANYFFGRYEKIRLFKALKDRGFFKAPNNPKPERVKNGYRIPEWNILTYLEKVSQRTRSIDKELLTIIRDVSLYRDKAGRHIDNYRTWWFFVKILLNIPLSKAPFAIFTDAIPVWLDSQFDLTLSGADLATKLLPTYLQQASRDDIKKVEKLIEVLLSMKDPEIRKGVGGKVTEIQTKIDRYWLEEAFMNSETIALIASKCSNEPILGLANTIKKAFNYKKYEKQDYSSVWLQDLTKKQEKILDDGEYFLAAILREWVFEKAKNNVEDGNEIIKNFLSAKYPHDLFKRLAILLVAENWDDYKKFFDEILNDREENYFDIDSYYPELAHLLKKNVSYLTKEQREKVKSIIERGPKVDLPEEQIDKYTNYWKQRWYKTLIELPEFKKLHDEIKKITNQEIVEEKRGEGELINFDKSPLSTEDFLKKSNKEIVGYIRDYKPTGDFPDSAPEGIQRVFQSAIRNESGKFTENLDPFKEADYHTLSSLFSGLKEAWEDQKNINWERVIEFITELVSDQKFWRVGEKDKTSSFNYFDWTLSAIASLLQEGCKTDEWAFDESLHKGVENIIGIITSNLPDSAQVGSKDSVIYSLNSTWGKILGALIYLSLREARLSDKKKENKVSKWSSTLRDYYEEALNRKIFEAYTLLGEYLPNMHYIDKTWVEDKVKGIHTISRELFVTFMEGYLFQGRVYEILYKILRDAYKRALKVGFEERRIQERLIQHITVGYLRGNENLDDESLIDKVIISHNSSYIREVVEFMWHQRDYTLGEAMGLEEKIEKEKLEFKERILFFWDYIIKYYKKKKRLTEEDKKTIGDLSKFAVYLEKIDKQYYEHLAFSAPYIADEFDSPYFIKCLSKLKDRGDKKETAYYIAKLFISMLNGADVILPNYEWTQIEEIVKHLYEVGASDNNIKSLADQICIIYAEHDNLGLRELYEENNQIARIS